MKTLLWKDWRINQFVLAFGAAMLAGPFLVGVTMNLYAQWRYGMPSRPWPDLLALLSALSLSLSLLTLAMLGGNAIACERADRSAEFLAYLPPTRRGIVGSKATLAISAGLIIWLVNLVAMYGIVPLTGELSTSGAQFFKDGLPNIAATGVLAFGAAWLGSSFLASPAIATGLGIFAPVTVVCVLGTVHYFLNPPGFDMARWYNIVCVPLGVGCFVAGTAYYLRRLEP